MTNATTARTTARTTAPTYAPALDQPGEPLEPIGDPMTSGLGPSAWANRADVPDLTVHGDPKIVPMRVAQNFYIEPRDPDPRGMRVVGCDGEVAGVITDVWVDRAEPQVRYFEVELPAGAAAAAGTAGRRVLMPAPV
ncbi:MAG TPA: PRC-barrel domain-containing protein, partial [Gemmatirosa sp.]